MNIFVMAMFFLGYATACVLVGCGVAHIFKKLRVLALCWLLK